MIIEIIIFFNRFIFNEIILLKAFTIISKNEKLQQNLYFLFNEKTYNNSNSFSS